MFRKAMVVLFTAAALTGGLTSSASARGGGFGGGAHMGGGFGGGGPHMSSGFAGGGLQVGSGFGGARLGDGFGRGFAGPRFAGTHAYFDHDRRFGRGLHFGGGWDHGLYDYGCGYGYPYYNLYSCYSPAY